MLLPLCLLAKWAAVSPLQEKYLHCREKVGRDLDGRPACEHLMDLSCSSQAWRHKSRAYGGAEPESFWVWYRSGIWGCKGGRRWIGTLSRVLGPCVAHPYPHLPLPPDHSAASDLPMLLSHLLDWSCLYIRTCFALTFMTSKHLLCRGSECLHHRPDLLAGSVVRHLLPLEPQGPHLWRASNGASGA